jgi:hypothetical protein
MSPERFVKGESERTQKCNVYRAAIDEFVSDIRHIRFVESSNYNWTALHDYIDRNDLDAANPENLHLAYEALARDHFLELLPLGRVQETPQQEPVPAPPAPTPSKAQTFMWRNAKPITGSTRRL